MFWRDRSVQWVGLALCGEKRVKFSCAWKWGGWSHPAAGNKGLRVSQVIALAARQRPLWRHQPRYQLRVRWVWPTSGQRLANVWPTSGLDVACSKTMFRGGRQGRCLFDVMVWREAPHRCSIVRVKSLVLANQSSTQQEKNRQEEKKKNIEMAKILGTWLTSQGEPSVMGKLFLHGRPWNRSQSVPWQHRIALHFVLIEEAKRSILH